MLEVGHFVKNATPPQFAYNFAFTAPLSLITLRLAAVLDSLVRVSRRVVLRHFARVLTSYEGALTSRDCQNHSPASHAGTAPPECTQ